MKKLGFSFEEMACFNVQDSIDLLDIYLEDMERQSGTSEKKTLVREATQEDIDKFLSM